MIPLWISLLLLVTVVTLAVYMFLLIAKNPGVTPWSDGEEHAALMTGTIEDWPNRGKLVQILYAAGLETTVGQHAFHLTALPSFVFRNRDGPAPPGISGDHHTVDGLREIAAKVSIALAQNNIGHRFEVYDGAGRRVAFYGVD